MYDNEEEIQRKRKKLLIIIGAVIGIIILLLIIIIAKSTRKSKPKQDPNLQITCELEVLNGVQPNPNGIYTQEIEVGFKNIVGISEEYPVEKQKIGTTDNSRNTETFKVTKSGTYKLHGYIQDTAGNKNTCDLSVVVELTKPECELEVVEGKLGEGDWYVSDVVVGFKSMNSNSDTVGIKKYYIEKQKVDLDTQAAIRADEPTASAETYKITEDQTTTVIGYVIDANGTEGSCTLEIKKDSTKPECSLKVESGSPDSTGVYKDAPTIGFNETKDSVTAVVSKGVGVKENYTAETYKVDGNGKIVVYGYVKDEAGNKGTCSIEIKRPEVVKKPTCKISSVKNSNGSVKVSINATGGTEKILDYYGGTQQGENKGKVFTLSTPGTYTIYGYVVDVAGNSSSCTSKVTVENSKPAAVKLASKVKVGQYVSYDAGNWSEAPTNMKNNASVGGFTNGASRNKGVTCANSTAKDGWVVLSVSNGKVTLVHAGIPECIYYGVGRTNPSGSTTQSERTAVINKMNSEAAKFVNGTYAESAKPLNCNDGGLTCAKDVTLSGIFANGTNYLFTETQGTTNMYFVEGTKMKRGGVEHELGIRPIVVLKASVLYKGGSGTQQDPYKIGV